jgi:hypothetical protein
MGSAAKAVAAKAVTFTIDENTEELLDKIKAQLGKTSRAEVLRKAIALLQVATEAEQDGGGIAVVDKDGDLIKIKLL